MHTVYTSSSRCLELTKNDSLQGHNDKPRTRTLYTKGSSDPRSNPTESLYMNPYRCMYIYIYKHCKYIHISICIYITYKYIYTLYMYMYIYKPITQLSSLTQELPREIRPPSAETAASSESCYDCQGSPTCGSGS